jgi:hypothetical protein
MWTSSEARRRCSKRGVAELSGSGVLKPDAGNVSSEAELVFEGGAFELRPA